MKLPEIPFYYKAKFNDYIFKVVGYSECKEGIYYKSLKDDSYCSRKTEKFKNNIESGVWCICSKNGDVVEEKSRYLAFEEAISFIRANPPSDLSCPTDKTALFFSSVYYHELMKLYGESRLVDWFGVEILEMYERGLQYEL